MNLELSEEQTLLRDTLDRLLTGEYSFEQRRQYQGEPAGYSTRFWQHLADHQPFTQSVEAHFSRQARQDRQEPLFFHQDRPTN